MKHVTLTCKNHRNLRWHCKEVAVNGDGSYNGSRNIFFEGSTTSTGMAFHREVDGSILQECDCPSSDLTLIPDDIKEEETFESETEYWGMMSRLDWLRETFTA